MDKLRLLFEELYAHLESCSKAASLEIRGQRQIPPDLEEAYSILRKHLESEQAVRAFEQAARQICLSALVSFPYILDGNTALVEHFHVQLVDALTKEDLRPEEGSYVEEFLYYIHQRQRPNGGK